MNKKMGRYKFIIGNIILGIISICMICFMDESIENFDVRLTYGENHDSACAQMYYASSLSNFNDAGMVEGKIKQDEVVFSLCNVDASENLFRIDPLTEDENFSIKSVDVILGPPPICLWVLS